MIQELLFVCWLEVLFCVSTKAAVGRITLLILCGVGEGAAEGEAELELVSEEFCTGTSSLDAVKLPVALATPRRLDETVAPVKMVTLKTDTILLVKKAMIFCGIINCDKS